MMREEFDRKLEEIRGTGSRISDEDYKAKMSKYVELL